MTGSSGNAAAPGSEGDEMAEVEERIARLQELLATPDAEAEADEDVLRHHLCQLRQLRAEMSDSVR